MAREHGEAALVSFAAPTAGLVTSQTGGQSAPQSAVRLENFLPTLRGIRVRGGRQRAAYTGGDAVKTLMVFEDAVTPAFFAATDGALYDISSLNATTAPAPEVSLLTSGDYSWQQIGTSGGSFMVAVNGAIHGLVYDGTSWNPWADEAIRDLAYDGLTTDFAVGETVTGGTSGATATIYGVVQATATTGTLKIGTVSGGPFQDNEAITSTSGAAVADGADAAASSFTVSGVDTADLSQVWLFKNRLFMVERNTMNAWYMPAGQIGGTATQFSLAGVFQRGGALLFGASWTMDGGDGLDDKCVFVSTEGEVALYSGTDPSSPSTFGLDGRYDIGRPLGKRAFAQVGGDLIIATDGGLVPLSAALSKDPTQISMSALSRPIEDVWLTDKELAQNDVDLQKWTRENIMAVTFPGSSRMLTINMQTTAWAVQPGWQGNCSAVFNNQLFIGRDDGRIYRLNETGTDDGKAFTARACWAFASGDLALRRPRKARISGFADSDFAWSPDVMFDDKVSFKAAPSAVPTNSDVGVWGTSNWGAAVWGSEIDRPITGFLSRWRSVSGTGYAFAPALQITSGGTTPLLVEITRIDLTVESGGRVV